MKLSQAGRKFIQSYEGLRLGAYKAVPTEEYWTIGYGHYGADVKEGSKITKEQAEDLFTKDVKRFEEGVSKAVKVEVTQNQFDAMVSLAYNIGTGAFSKSTLVKKINEKDFKGASEQFDLWNKSGGKVLRGLVNRRKAEREMFDKETPKKTTTTKPTPKAPSKPSYHLVKSGDNLTKIAKKYGLSLNELLKLNPTIRNANLIFVNQKIKIKK